MILIVRPDRFAVALFALFLAGGFSVRADATPNSVVSVLGMVETEGEQGLGLNFGVGRDSCLLCVIRRFMR